MVEENVNVAEPVAQTPTATPEPEPTVDSRPTVDMEAVNAIKAELSGYKEKMEQQNEKLKELDRIKKAIVGEDLTNGMNEKEKERFFQDLAENPTETIKRITRETASEASNNELAEIRQWKKQQELAQANMSVMSSIRAADPDFDNVFNNMGKYLSAEEIEKYQNQTDGFEIAYAKAKMKMEIDNRNKAQQTQTATNTAKNIANQTANSEVPNSSGRTNEPSIDDIDRNIDTAIREGNWNKGEGITPLDVDIFAQFHRDAYGIKPKR